MSEQSSVLWPESIERVTNQFGAPHHLTEFDPDDTALLVIDMQNFYLDEKSTNYCPAAHDIVSNINKLAASMRSAGCPIIWLRNIITFKDPKDWASFYDRMTPERLELRKAALSKEGDGFKFWEGLDIRSDDLKMNKHRFSAFAPDSSNVEKALGEHGIEILVMCGIVTNVCVESTARDAMMRNYKVAIAEDACAAGTQRVHEASLNTLYTHFADVHMTDDLVEIFDKMAD